VTLRALAAAALLGTATLAGPSCAASNAGAERDSLAAPSPTSVADLPLVEVPAVGRRDVLAILLTGDGGWAELDRVVARTLAEHDVAVVGLDSRAYLSRRRTPEATADAVARVARHYAAAWGRDSVVLVGYSRGADILPFVVDRLPPDVRPHVALVAMLGLARGAGFHFHWADLLRETSRPDDLPVLPELERLRGTVPMLCIYGAEEKESGCRDADPTLVERVERTGGHHFDGDYASLAGEIVRRIGAGAGAGSGRDEGVGRGG
jgi:type IV secretory pathway VirJ component